jgi:hypothetical protein
MWTKKLLLCAVALSAVFGRSEIVNTQNLRELAKKQAVHNPGVPLVQPASPAEYLPKTIEELTRESDVVLQGRLAEARSYLSPSEDRVLTDYLILEPRIVSGRLLDLRTLVPGQGPQLI